MRFSLLVLLLSSSTLQADPLDNFAGFSKDGTQFAWVSRSNILPDVQNLYIIAAGSDAAKSYPLDLDQERAKKLLKDGGFTDKRKNATGLNVTANLTAVPPTVTVTQNGQKKTHTIDQGPFPPSDTWETWGLDASGRYLAIHIFGKPVDGVVTKAKGGTLHFYRVIPLR